MQTTVLAAWERLVQQVARRATPPEEPPPGASEDLELVRQAHQDWLTAKAYFESVSDPELVDHAIALLTAAEQRYAYLIRRARRHGLTDAEVERVLGIRLPEPARGSGLSDGDRPGGPEAIAVRGATVRRD